MSAWVRLRRKSSGVRPGDHHYGWRHFLGDCSGGVIAALTFGNVSRNIGYRGPGEGNWDISLFKDFTVKERFKGQFRAEGLNAFNTPLFANPNTNISSAQFGKVVYQTNTPREVQLGVRVSF